MISASIASFPSTMWHGGSRANGRCHRFRPFDACPSVGQSVSQSVSQSAQQPTLCTKMEFRFPCGGGGGGASNEIPLSSDPQSRLLSVGRRPFGRSDRRTDGPRNVNHIARIRVAVSQFAFLCFDDHPSPAPPPGSAPSCPSDHTSAAGGGG